MRRRKKNLGEELIAFNIWDGASNRFLSARLEKIPGLVLHSAPLQSRHSACRKPGQSGTLWVDKVGWKGESALTTMSRTYRKYPLFPRETEKKIGGKLILCGSVKELDQVDHFSGSCWRASSSPAHSAIHQFSLA